MSFTSDEVKTLKAIAADKVKPKQYFDYAYKNSTAHAERELTQAEIANWKGRIDLT